MGKLEAHDPEVLRHYEGLVLKTAAIVKRSGSEEDFDDIAQVLRIKVYRALLRWDPAIKDQQAYVFMCVRDQAKDLVKKRRRHDSYIEDLVTEPPSDALMGISSVSNEFEQRHLATDRDEVYGLVDEGMALIPNTLTRLEVEIVCLLYRDYKQSEVARELRIGKREMERAMRSIRTKMADWQPTPATSPAANADDAEALAA